MNILIFPQFWLFGPVGRTLSGICVLGALVVAPVMAQASEATFKPRHIEDGVTMTLKGTAVKRMFLFKAFAAGFYAQEDAPSILVGETPKRIEVEYFVSIPAERLTRFTIDRMRANVSEDAMDGLKDKIARMGVYFVDLQPGDRFSLTYIPGVGTKFAHNGDVRGVIPGRDFAAALFSVWLGPKPFDKNLKTQILGSASS